MDDLGFLELDSVPGEKVEPLTRWAHTHVVSPAPSELHEGLSLRVTEDLGMHAVARKRFSAGDLVLREQALLRIPDLSAKLRRSLEQRYGSRAAFFFPALAIDWGSVPQDVRRALAMLFWAGPVEAAKGSPMARANMDTCADLLHCHPHVADYWSSPHELMRLLHAVDLNIHRDDEVRDNAGYAGLFVLGSKFTHSCVPNCCWSFGQNGCLQYRAIRTIEPGENFTFSYVGNGMNLIVSTIERRRRLASLWFYCACDRCSGWDMSRQMRCPMCAEPRCRPAYLAPGSSRGGWDGSMHLNDLVPEASTWECSACGATPSAKQLPLEVEEELACKVPEVMQRDVSDVVKDAMAVAQLRAQASRVLGEGHWTWMLATFAWLQKCFHIVCRSPIVPFQEDALKEASTAVARWFEESAPDNIEQRLSAMFLATRLAHNLGGSLTAWGYDPEDTLGNTGRSIASRLNEHGWGLGGPNSDEPHLLSNEVRGVTHAAQWSPLPPREPRRKGSDHRLYAASKWR